ncbi:putative 2-aminoethylphosphonate ABC transporter substrate-binding protein [Thermocoleostomius sinensis]|jgi:iron(III) transport system substrate-binding protein|uniref:2-aminoethylphosphonate ABC transporter substrate-binding protein n=1 Tax=Thermocoleostomius sinensis A174 TaxID=2016057 RepID=A0A9E8ZED1_9CYAN|nr:putative 2-aminoethylphosphonate ABC transporter substrate-binding protein [Thermocoleostomius sinensis]WAL59813.1 putative 2-aminoethylphosphonate ABC transporter substrate-binding protein [Thermocoleostomius sinensis A174]
MLRRLNSYLRQKLGDRKSFRKSLKLGSLFVSALAVTLFTAACIADQAAIEQADSTSTGASGGTSTLTVYTALEDDQIKDYLSSWNEQNPNTTVNIVRDSTGIVTAKLLAEKDNPQADVVWGLAASSLLVADQQGMLEPYAPAGLEKVRPRFRDDRTPPHWVGIDVWSSAFCVNTVESERKGLAIPQSWDDLIKPEYQGQIVMSNPASSGTGFLSVSAILQLKGEEAGWQYLDALHQNIAQYMHSGSKPCKAAGAGEYPIGISFDYRAVKQKNDGEPIAAVFPKEGSGWDVEANALVKKTSIKPEARAFLDWAISEPVSEKYAQNFGITAVKTSVPVPDGFPADPEAQLIENDLNWAAENRDRILEEWTRRYDSKSEPKEG